MNVDRDFGSGLGGWPGGERRLQGRGAAQGGRGCLHGGLLYAASGRFARLRQGCAAGARLRGARWRVRRVMPGQSGFYRRGDSLIAWRSRGLWRGSCGNHCPRRLGRKGWRHRWRWHHGRDRGVRLRSCTLAFRRQQLACGHCRRCAVRTCHCSMDWRGRCGGRHIWFDGRRGGTVRDSRPDRLGSRRRDPAIGEGCLCRCGRCFRCLRPHGAWTCQLGGGVGGGE